MIDVTGSSDALGPSPIGVEVPARDGPWILRAARVRAEGNHLRGVQLVTSGELVLMTGCTGSARPAATVRLDPGLVTRRWSDASIERIWTALTLPLVVWEHHGSDGVLEWHTPVGSQGSIESLEAHSAGVVHENGKRIWFAALGGALSAQLKNGISHFRFEHSGPARLVAIAVVDEADGRRTMDHLARRGIPGLATQRAQHSSHISKLGTLLRTPDEAINRAFSWALILCESAATTGALDSEDLLISGSHAAGLQGAIRGTETRSQGPVPARGVLSRLRESAALVEQAGTEFFGPDPSRAAAILIDGVRGLFGVTVDESAGALSLMPALPREWPSMALERLRAGKAVLDVEVRRRPSATAVAVRVRSGGPLTVSVELPDAAVAQVDLDDVVMPANRARLEARHDHLLVFRHAD